METPNPALVPHATLFGNSDPSAPPFALDESADTGSEDDDEESELGEEVLANRDTNDKPEVLSFKSVASSTKAFNEDGTVRTIIRAKKSAFVNSLIHLDGKRFDFTGREYLLSIYDRNDKQILLKTARQVEKTVPLDAPILLSNGTYRKAGDIRLGDVVAQLNLETMRVEPTGTVSWVSAVYQKPCRRIITRTGKDINVAVTHPVRVWGRWRAAEHLFRGMRVASVTRMDSAFTCSLSPPNYQIELLAFLLGDGHIPEHGQWSFTQMPGPQLTRYEQCLGEASVRFSTSVKKGTSAKVVRHAQLDFVNKLGLGGSKSATKFIPDSVFEFDREKTALFLNRLWSTDGHVKRVTSSKYEIVYASISRDLILGVQALLWKFGIPSTIRENLPKIYKDRGEPEKVAYLLRVETAEGVTAFLGDIGALGKSESVLPPNLEKSNNNRHTLPIGVSHLISKIYTSTGCKDRRGKRGEVSSLFDVGLRKKPEYALTLTKARRYLEYFKSGEFDADLVSELEAHINSCVCWDEIVDIQDIGEQDCVDFTAGPHHNYIVGGVVTHNSTFLANNLVVTSAIKPYNKALYVSPSHSQTRQFSNEKLRSAIDGSPIIKKYLQDHLVSAQVFEKGFTNGSYVFLRSAFRTADRSRGISARNLCLDELQDFMISQIPVITECTSHFPDSSIFMAGTPKSFDNPIEVYWNETTQNEWLVPCKACGKRNFLDERCIAPTQLYVEDKLPPGPVCSKCMQHIHVPDGYWVSMSPGKSIQGYRIPQLMVPWIWSLREQWLKLLWKRDNYPFGQFSNEVLGLSYDSASKPITRDEVIECCSDYALWNPSLITPQVVQEAHRVIGLTAGVDWGEGNDGSEKGPTGKLRTASYTVLTVGAYVNQKTWKTFLIKKYTGREIDPDYVVSDICRICQVLGVKLVGVDWGHGWGTNNVMVRKLGPDKVVQYQHLPKLKRPMKWDPQGFRYHLSRNFMMSELFFDMKHKLVMFPRWSEFEPYAKDILSIYSEWSEYKREIRFDHRASDPDDCFHSLLYAKLTSDLYLGKTRRYTKDVCNADT